MLQAALIVTSAIRKQGNCLRVSDGGVRCEFKMSWSVSVESGHGYVFKLTGICACSLRPRENST